MGSKPETVPYAHGAAGHQGISTSADGALLIKPCTQAEIDFYESASAHPDFQAHMPVYMGSLKAGDSEIQKHADRLQSEQSEPPRSPIADVKGHARSASGHIVSEPKIARSATKEWTPSGGAKLTSNLSIVLSNATAGFQKPNVIDLKLGARLWDDDAPQAKRAKLDEVARTSTSGSLGFRVAGMKVYVGDSEVERDVNTTVEGGYKVFDKFYGRSNVNDDNIQSAFEAFLSSLTLAESKASRKAQSRHLLVVERLLREVSSIEFALENEESRMYSASILLVYEGDSKALDSVVDYQEIDGRLVIAKAIEPDGEVEEDEENEEDDEEEMKQKIHEAVMIDFAHAHWTPGQGPDENALKGVRSIKLILTKVLQDSQKMIQA